MYFKSFFIFNIDTRQIHLSILMLDFNIAAENNKTEYTLYTAASTMIAASDLRLSIRDSHKPVAQRMIETMSSSS